MNEALVIPNQPAAAAEPIAGAGSTFVAKILGPAKTSEFGLNRAAEPVDVRGMNRRRCARPQTSRPTELSPGPSETGFEFLLWRAQRLEAKRVDDLLLAEAQRQLRLERLPD